MFKVSARTLLHLGAELISSDAVAFYELIKNSFDANSKRVKIEVVSRVDYEMLQLLYEELAKLRQRFEGAEPDDEAYVKVLVELREAVELETGHLADELLGLLNGVETFDDLEAVLDEANYIMISDVGDGMSLEDLQEIYLTIGTGVRAKQREEASSDLERPILGEKGIGRLSVMRLGWGLRVRTTQAGAEHWAELEVDWRQFDDYDKLIEEVKVEPKQGKKKEDVGTKGTELYIYRLSSTWSVDKLRGVAKKELSKFVDPFARDAWFPVVVRFNGEVIVVPRMQELLFAHANMVFQGELRHEESGPRFEGHLSLKEQKTRTKKEIDRSTAVVRNTTQLMAIAGVSEKRLKQLGPFKIKLYWFNRRLLGKIEGLGEQAEVRELQRQWSGIMLFRDGFRIHPYGNEDDDWLDFDSIALGRKSYKLNKAQFIGKIDIGRKENPQLIDQANREGLKDTPEKQALIYVVRNLVQHEVWRIIKAWEEEAESVKPQAEIRRDIAKLSQQANDLARNLDQDDGRGTNSDGNTEPQKQIAEFKRLVQNTLGDAAKHLQAAEDERAVVMHLAGIGFMVEVVAHELKKAISPGLDTVGKLLKGRRSTDNDQSSLRILEAQLKNIEKRVRTLDPHSTSARNRKETFDVVEWTRMVLDSHEIKLKEIGATCTVQVAPKGDVKWEVLMVKGIYIQIVENIVNNALYWMGAQKSRIPKFKPHLSVLIDAKAKRVSITDNGPGIPFEQGESIFQPFFTTRPAGESRGLGLYIARENATYNNLTLDVAELSKVHEGHYNTFVICWEEEK